MRGRPSDRRIGRARRDGLGASTGLGRPRRIAPGSLEDRVLEVIPPAPVDIEVIVAAGKALRPDVIACLQQLRREGRVVMLGNKRGARYVRA